MKSKVDWILLKVIYIYRLTVKKNAASKHILSNWPNRRAYCLSISAFLILRGQGRISHAHISYKLWNFVVYCILLEVSIADLLAVTTLVGGLEILHRRALHADSYQPLFREWLLARIERPSLTQNKSHCPRIFWNENPNPILMKGNRLCLKNP